MGGGGMRDRNTAGEAEAAASPLPETGADLEKYLNAFVAGLSYRDPPAPQDLPRAEYLEESEETGCCAVCGKTDAVAVVVSRGTRRVSAGGWRAWWPCWCLCRGCLPLALVDDHYGVLRLLVRSWDGALEE